LNLVNGLMLRGTAFRNWLNNAVGNITITTTPGLEPTTGVFVPAGGALRQRQNVDRIVATGLESELAWAASPQWDFSLRYQLTSPKIVRSAAQPGLVGLRLAQVAKHQAAFSATYRPDERWTLKGEVRTSSRQFDDDQNTRALKGYTVLDLYVDRAITDNAVVFISGENVLDQTIHAGISADRLVTVGAPASISGGLRVKF